MQHYYLLKQMIKCEKHGYTLFKFRQSKKGSWYVCHICLKSQYKKAQDKKRKNPEYLAFHREYYKKNREIKKCLSVYLIMILLAAKITPE